MGSALVYRRILVPIGGNRETEKAMDVACRIACERSGVIAAVAVVEVPAVLPLNAHMREEEARAHELLERASAITASYGIRISTSCVRARDPGAAILEQAALDKCEIIIIGASRKRPATRGTSVFGTTVEDVLKRASCRVMVIGAAPIDVYAVNAAA